MGEYDNDIWHVDYNRTRHEQAAQGWNGIFLVFGVNSVMFLFAITIFYFSRSGRTSLYYVGENPPKLVGKTVYEKFQRFLATNNDVQSLHEQVGDEAAFYLMFQVYSLRLLLAMTAYAFIFLIPIYIILAKTELSAFSTMTIRSIPDESPFLWLPVGSCYIFSVMYGYFLRQLSTLCHNKDPSRTNLLCMLPSSLSAKSILVNNGVPKDMAQERIFGLLDQIFPGYISHVNVVYDLAEYKKHKNKRVKKEHQAETYQTIHDMTMNSTLPLRIRLFPGNVCCITPCSYKSPSVSDRLLNLHSEIEELKILEQNALDKILTTHRGAGRIFIIFENPKCKARFVRRVKRRSATYICSRATLDQQHRLKKMVQKLMLTKWEFEAAPEPDDIDWNALSFPFAKRTLMTTIIYVFLTLFIIIFTSPVAVTSAISDGSYSNTAKSVSEFVYETKQWVSQLSPTMATIFFSYIPTIILVMINAVLLNVVYHAGRMQPMATDSAKEKSILRYSAVYLIFNTLFVPSFTFVSIRALIVYFMHKGQVLDIFEMLFLNNSGVFFVNYVIQRAFVGTAVVLLRFSEAFEFTWRTLRAVTVRDKQNTGNSWQFFTGTQSALQISMLVVIVSFSTAVPVILPFGAFYMIMQHLVDKYSLLYVRATIKGKGTIARTTTHASMFGLIIYQCAMSGFFVVRGTLVQMGSVLVLLMFTFILILWWYIQDKEKMYRDVSKAYTLEQTRLLSPYSGSVEMYSDPDLRTIDRAELQSNERYGSI